MLDRRRSARARAPLALSTAFVLLALAVAHGAWRPSAAAQALERGAGARTEAAPRAPAAAAADLVAAAHDRGERTAAVRPAGAADLAEEPAVAGAGQAPSAPEGEARQEPCTLVLELVDASTDSPCIGLAVELSTAAGAVPARSDESGRVELRLPPGSVRWRLPPPPGSAALRCAPNGTTLAPAARSLRHEVRVSVLQPPAVLEVLVLTGDGAPAPGAQVRCLSGGPWQEHARGTTDAAGLARLALWERRGDDGLLLAQRDAQASDPLLVPGPFVPGRRTLVLREGASIDALALGPEGPLADEELSCQSLEIVGLRVELTTDERGHARFDALPDGLYELRLALADYTEPIERELPAARGRVEQVVLVAPDRAGERLCAGRVLDEGGAPLSGVAVRVELGEELFELESDDEGAFALSGPRTGRLEVVVGTEPGADRFAPARVRVACGTQGLVFRRVEEARELELFLEVLDAETRRRLPRFFARVEREGGRPIEAPWYDQDDCELDEALTSAELLEVRAPGYRSRKVRLRELVDAEAEDPQQLVLALEPGFEERLVVRGWPGGGPLPGARVQSAELCFVTGEDGAVVLRAADWGPWTVEREGYASARWDPLEDYYWDEWELWLERLDQDE